MTRREGSEVQMLLVIIVPAILVLAIAFLYPLKPAKEMMPARAELTDISGSATGPPGQVFPFPATHQKVSSLHPRSQPEGVLLALPGSREASDSEKIEAGASG